jgi:hypothetical protein
MSRKMIGESWGLNDADVAFEGLGSGEESEHRSRITREPGKEGRSFVRGGYGLVVGGWGTKTEIALVTLTAAIRVDGADPVENEFLSPASQGSTDIRTATVWTNGMRKIRQ